MAEMPGTWFALSKVAAVTMWLCCKRYTGESLPASYQSKVGFWKVEKSPYLLQFTGQGTEAQGEHQALLPSPNVGSL